MYIMTCTSILFKINFYLLQNLGGSYYSSDKNVTVTKLKTQFIVIKFIH